MTGGMIFGPAVAVEQNGYNFISWMVFNFLRFWAQIK
jgi:hypothetical protein